MKELNYYYFDEVTSTNDFLKENYQRLSDYTICFTSFQTKGRGRMGRTWIGQKGNNIALSMIVKDLRYIKNFETITLEVAAIVHKFCSKYIPNIEIKWPNDLLVNGKKLCGILTEGISYSDRIDAVVIGIGININQKHFDETIDFLTTSFNRELNKAFYPNSIALDLGYALYQGIDQFIHQKTNSIYYIKNHLYGINETIEYIQNNETHEGTLLDIEEDGKLKIQTKDSIQYVSSMEIKIIRK